MKIIDVKVQNSFYPILIGENILHELPSYIKSLKLHNNFFIVLDRNVGAHFGDKIKEIFNKTDSRNFFYYLSSKEKSKSHIELKKIYSALLENQFGRDTALIAIGGGITGDLAGFAASTFMRGIQLIHIPTTLTAMVDSSIGGKTGINFNYYKNIIGTFYHPKFVMCDVNFLQTLPEIEMISGLGEVIKYAFITDKDYYKNIESNFNLILNRDLNVLENVIINSLNYKASIVQRDEKESGLRKVLNFGHTFAHAFEAELRHEIKHGEAVTAGVLCALFLSYRKKLIGEKYLQEFSKLPLKLKLNKSFLQCNPQNVYQKMFADKKSRDKQINFVLLRNIGEMILDVKAAQSQVIDSIKYSLKLFNHSNSAS